MDTRKLAQDIVQHVGGKGNIGHLEHCVTRLRFTLKDNGKANTDIIKEMDGVMTVVISGGQYQVVIGNRVKDVFKDVTEELGTSFSEESQSAEPVKKKNMFNRFIDVIVGIISPIIGLMATAGILKGLLALSTAMNWLTAEDGTYILLNALGDGILYFLPILLGFSAGRKFGGNPYIPAAIGAALVYPTIVSAYAAGSALTFVGIPIVLANYTSSLFPIILAAWIASKIEKWLEAKLPASLKLFFVPLITILITGIATFLAVGPVLTEFSSLLATATMGIYNLSPVVAGIILGAFWQLIVIFGLHYAFIPVLINNITTLQYDPVNAILGVTVFAQVGAALGVFFKTKNKKLRSIAGPAAFSAMLGVTEPAIYGVSLPYRKPFITAGIAGGIAGGAMALMGGRMFGFGGAGIFATPLFINPAGMDISFYAFLITSALSLLLSTILTYLFGFKDKIEAAPADPTASAVSAASDARPASSTIASADKQVFNAIAGTLIPLASVRDEAFASGAMGEGYAIVPSDNKVYAPFDGTVFTVANSKHAIALVSDTGVELLIHMGINTVKLKGAPFDIRVSEGEHVLKGQLIAVADWDLIVRENYDVTTPIIVTNHFEHSAIDRQVADQAEVHSGDLTLRIS